ncbi:MAG: SUMF1/EgtB/PvdO family nonheme iron enzyme [Candidatus Cloacimonetes bacterium]|nr:SUMF1/EgtB/PvdO family nonheme iron enzyme [Candidatus Cloacimonadota bacterium]
MDKKLNNPMDPGSETDWANLTFNPPGGAYPSEQSVTISCPTSGVTIHYTTNGSEPTESSALYSSPITVSQNSTIKAKAFKNGWNPSSTASASYIITTERMVYVAGGTFHNGTSNVTVSSFYIGKYELTQAEYQAVMGSNPSSFAINPNHPVEQVSWFNAIEYCNRRSIMESLTPCYSYDTYGSNPDNWSSGWNSSSGNHTNVSRDWTANGYRLPTEMEWMFASKGGNQSQGFTYSGSNNIDDVAWYSGNSASMTHAVGAKAPNELGVYDMSGNVWEWVWDIYGDYPSGLQTNPHGASSGSYRVRRGGGWSNVAGDCTVSSRGGNSAIVSSCDLGFRICINAN